MSGMVKAMAMAMAMATVTAMRTAMASALWLQAVRAGANAPLKVWVFVVKFHPLPPFLPAFVSFFSPLF
jgi:hypothetical protein